MKRNKKLKRSPFNKRILVSKSYSRQIILGWYKGYGQFAIVLYNLTRI
jgi:hypothetical protein